MYAAASLEPESGDYATPALGRRHDVANALSQASMGFPWLVRCYPHTGIHFILQPAGINEIEIGSALD